MCDLLSVRSLIDRPAGVAGGQSVCGVLSDQSQVDGPAGVRGGHRIGNL